VKAAACLVLAVLLIAGCVKVEVPSPSGGGPPTPSAASSASTGPDPGRSVSSRSLSSSGSMPAVDDGDGPVTDSLECPRSAAREPVPANLAIGSDGTIGIHVPLDVVLVGFPGEVATALQAALPPLPVDQVYTHDQLGHQPQPLAATVVYRVASMSEPVGARFIDGVRAGPDGLADANLAEAALAEALACDGFELSWDRPTLVFLHLGDDRVGDHSYVYTGEEKPHGSIPSWVPDVRVFGAAAPLLAMDVSAAADPDPTYGDQGRDYERPLRRDAPQLVPALAHAAVNATLQRFYPDLTHSIYIEPCSAFTLIYGIRASAAAGPGTLDPVQQAHADRLVREFEALTHHPVFVDLQTVEFPADDPELDALTRALGMAFVSQYPEYYTSLAGLYEPVPPPANAVAQNAFGQAVQALGAWVESNWESRVVAHEGCAEYLGVIVWPDASEPPHDYGFSTTTTTGKRWMLGSVGVYGRWTASGSPVYGRDPALGTYDNVDSLVAHEFGHSIGLHHPHQDTNGGPDTYSFSKAMDTMSYPWAKRTAVFGVLDEVTIARGRAGFALQAAWEEGRLATPAGQTALEALERWDWRAVATVLEAP
jgi:hypothetical protein